MTPPHPAPDADHGPAVLHTLRCGGHADTGRVAAATGLTADEAESALIDLAIDGLVTRHPGPFPGWGLTDAGRAAHAERTARELEEAGVRDAVAAAFERFLELNPEVLDLCTAWQLRPVDGVPAVNDHSDPAYDARVLDRFAELHRRAAPVYAQLAEALPRFDRYRVRLTDALDRARAGATEYVADHTASFHTVWAELHEDLLATLGIPR